MDIPIKENGARARKAEADGEATYIEQTGRARGAEIEAVGLARARGFEAQDEETLVVTPLIEKVLPPDRIQEIEQRVKAYVSSRSAASSAGADGESEPEGADDDTEEGSP